MEVDLLRGKCFYSSEAQAAEYFLRSELKLKSLDEVSLISEFGAENGIINIVFKTKSPESGFQVSLEKNDKALQLLASCRDKHEKFIAQYKLIGISQI